MAVFNPDPAAQAAGEQDPNSINSIGGKGTFNPYTAVGVGKDGFEVIYDNTLHGYQYPTSGPAGSDQARIAAQRATEDTPQNTQSPSSASNFDLLKSLYTMDPGQLGGLQTALKAAGYGEASWRPVGGMMDSGTLVAYNQLLRDTAAYQANDTQAGYTPDTLLAARITGLHGASDARGGRGGSGVTATGDRLDDPLFVQHLAQGAYDTHLGRKPNAKETAAIGSALRAYAASERYPSVGNAEQLASNVVMSDQNNANQAGALNETRFADVLMSMMSRRMT